MPLPLGGARGGPETKTRPVSGGSVNVRISTQSVIRRVVPLSYTFGTLTGRVCCKIFNLKVDAASKTKIEFNLRPSPNPPKGGEWKTKAPPQTPQGGNRNKIDSLGPH